MKGLGVLQSCDHCAVGYRELQAQEALQNGQPGSGDGVPDLQPGVLASQAMIEKILGEDPRWQDTNFVLGSYKTEQCPKPPRLCRQGYACPHYHNSRDRRRNPRRFQYRCRTRWGPSGARASCVKPSCSQSLGPLPPWAGTGACGRSSVSLLSPVALWGVGCLLTAPTLGVPAVGGWQSEHWVLEAGLALPCPGLPVSSGPTWTWAPGGPTVFPGHLDLGIGQPCCLSRPPGPGHRAALLSFQATWTWASGSPAVFPGQALPVPSQHLPHPWPHGHLGC
ncbi:hypothetical protein GHT09_017621 [Marmota monax]|uniref:Unkempt zinc finger domain-containing protein n=1 Tax=Marmota monax TaxID=9995 RepID=A0A834Q1W2_MARMO|nr:hypothetical protein GHT09_017621 [Marmota monax]